MVEWAADRPEETMAATTIPFFMAAEDEVAFLRALEPLALTLYPEFSEPSYQPLAAGAACAPHLEDEAYYLVLLGAGAVAQRQVLRGKHRGLLEVDEVRSPAIHWVRSQMDEEGQLRSGRLWVELDVQGERQRLWTRPDLLRSVVDRIRAYLKKQFHPSRPAGFLVGPVAAKRARGGLKMREAGRLGGPVEPFRQS
jgi:hypothetical protein